MGLFSRLFAAKQSAAVERAAMPQDDPGDATETGTEDVPHAAGWTVGGRWGTADGPPKRTPDPQYIPQTTEPSETDLAHEEQLYRQKNKPPDTN